MRQPPVGAPGRAGRERLRLATLLLLAAVLLVWARALNHHDVDTAEREQLAHQVAGLERILAIPLGSARSAMRGVRDDLAAAPDAERRSQAAQRFGTIETAIAGLGALRWLDARGRVVASLGGAPIGDDQSAQAVFRSARSRPDPALLIVATPVRDASGKITVDLAVPVVGADGRFGGVVAATLESRFFATVLASALYAADMHAAVVHGGGIAITFLPPEPARHGLDLARPGSLFTRFRGSGQDAFVADGPLLLNGERRLAAFQRMQPPALVMDTPLVLAVSRPTSVVFAHWTASNWIYATVYVGSATTAWLSLLAFQRRRAEQQRQEAGERARHAADEERLELALRGADLALWDLHVPSNTVEMNPRWHSMLGREPGPLVADQSVWEDMLHPDDKPRVLKARDDHIAGLTPSFDATYRLRHASGDWTWIVNRGRAVERDSAGRGVRLVGTNFDATQRVAAEEALRRSERDLAITLQSIGDGVIATDTAGCITRLNAAAEALTGWPAADALGQPLHAVFRIVEASTRVAAADPVDRALARGEVVSRADAVLLVARDGIERHVSDRAAPIRDAGGAVAGVVLVFSDVSRQVAALQAVRESEARSRSLLASLRSGVLIFDAGSVIVDANPSACRILGRPREALVGRPADNERWRFLAEDGNPLPPSRLPLPQVLETGEPVHDLMLGFRIGRDGSASAVVWVLCNAFALRDAAGALREVVVTFVDVTERMVAQDRLQQREKELRMASRLARLGVWCFDPESRRLVLAPESLALIGAPEAEGDPLAAAMAPADRARWQARLHRAVDDGLPIDDEFVAVGADGRALHWRILGETVRDAAGQLVAVQGAVQDVTGEREAQQQLRLLETAVASLNDAVVITEAPSELRTSPRIVFVNDAFERLSGYRRADVIGRSPRMLPGPESFDGPAFEPLRGGRRDVQPAHLELVQHRADGSRYWVEVSMVPMLHDGGQPSHFVSVQRDITDRRQAAAAIEAAQRELAATLAAVPDLLFDIDLEGRIHQCHAPPTRGPEFDGANLVDRRVGEVFSPDAATVILAALAEAQARGHSAGRQYESTSRAGTHAYELSVSAKPAPPGEPPRFIVLARDISERRQLESQRHMLERQLREAQKMESMGTLAGGIAHDFNNILAAILGNLALARDEIGGSHPAQSTLDQIGKASTRARSLVQQILAFSRRQLNPLRPRAFQPVVEETLALLRATLPAAVRLDSRLADEALVVSADATQLQQVVMNLCTNAWQALREGRGRIEVGLERLDAELRIADLDGDGPWAHLWVADDGAGMDAVTRERIFDPFFTTKPVGQGTGLGLSVVHGIVRSHRGTVAVETALGRGSTFHLYLPLVDAESREIDSNFLPLAPLGPPGAKGDPPGGGEHLLYVDDDEVMVLMVQRLLQRDGYRVTGCCGALEALDLLARPASDVALVISDFNMPEMSGTEFAERLGQARPELPMIITSGYLTDELRHQALALGVRALLQKERTLEELGGLVRQVLAGATVA